jgi:N-acetylneuraminate synthase
VIDFPKADEPPAFLAELGQTCGADVDAYVAAVERFAAVGVWGVKVQMLDPERLASPSALPYWSTSRYADTQAESFAKAGVVPHDGWEPVRRRCAELGVAFVATPFDLDAVRALRDLEPDAVKVASGDLTWKRLLLNVADFPQVILSTGAARSSEVHESVRFIQAAGRPALHRLMVLACHLAYPTADEHAALYRIEALRALVGSRLGVTVGLSDHTYQQTGERLMAVGAAAGALGARLVEKHVADGYHGEVPDFDMAVTPAQVKVYVEGLHLGWSLRGTRGLDVTPEEEPAREQARRSLVLRHDLPKGHVLTADDFTALRPGTGTSPMREGALLGLRLRDRAKAGQIIGFTTSSGGGVLLRTFP